MKKSTLYSVLLFLIIFINERFFYMSDRNSSKWIYLIGLLSIIGIILNFKLVLKNDYKFIFLISGYIFLNLISIIITIYKYNQPFELALSRYGYIVLFISYLYINIIIKKMGNEKVKLLLYKIGSFLSLIYIIQYILYPKIIILNMNYMYREGSLRFFYGSYFIVITTYITIELLINKFSKLKFLSLILQISYLLFIVQTRSITIAIIVSLLLGFTNIKKYLNKRNLLGMMLAILIFIPIFVPYISNSINSVKDTIVNKTSSSYYSRLGAINFVIENINEDLVFGKGLYNNNYDMAGSITGSDYKYYMDDIGVIGYIYQYGLIGGIIALVMLYKMIKLTHRIKKEKNKIFYRLFIIYTIAILAFNIPLNISNCIVYLLLIMSMLEKDVICDNNVKNF